MNRYEEILLEYAAFIKAANPMYVSPEPRLVTCEVDVPHSVSQVLDIVRPKQRGCYNNAFDTVAFLRGDAAYCLGYTICARVPVPIEHAWVRWDGKHYDPTFIWHGKMSSPDECAYGIIYEFTRLELVDFLRRQKKNEQYPPELCNVHRWGSAKAAA